MKKSISTLILAIIFTLSFTSITYAATVWLSDAVDDGGLGNCHYDQYTDIDGDGNPDSIKVLHGHWSNGTCLLGRVSLEQDSTNYSNGIFTAVWNIVLNAIQTGKAVIN